MKSPEQGGFMPFKGKVERAMRWNRKKRLEMEGVELPEDLDESELPTMEELRQEADEIELEKGDLKAMLLAGFAIIFPVCVGILLLIVLLCVLFAGGFS